MPSIYMIAYQTRDDNYFNQTYQTLDESWGYFHTLEDAENLVAQINQPPRDRWEAKLEEYAQESMEWATKDTEAKRLGFSNGDPMPSRPSPWDEPLPWIVVEIEDHKENL